MRPYTQKEKASLRRQWRAEFQAHNPESLENKRDFCDSDDTDSVATVMGPKGYCDLYDDGTVVTHGTIQDLFD